MDTIETFIEKFTEAVDFQEPVELTADTELLTLPEWDSLAALGVIVMCDMEYSKTITGNDLVKCVVLNDIYKLTS
ncbi:MAG: acyl carrier protein [Methylophilaceae bacterium]|uniref:acyl carrier protein n=1 Tax=Methylovorus sp. MM2 TaxID=1848038 RepID=UPI0007E0890D|nr:acyl carrier protein [Methylovorus sp. MM2]OAM52030.1 acyl carrier protein [Methylovorus sp. MM2]